MAVAAGVVGDLGVPAVLAARHMAAERCRPAALDGGHDLQLLQARVTGIGTTPGGAEVAEDVRDFQLTATHGLGRLGRWLDFGPVLDACPRLQEVERAVDLGDRACGNPRVACRGVELVVAQEGLDVADIGAALQEMGGEAVAQGM